MSGISFFNIWVSYGLQDFVTTKSTTQGQQTAARQEYHTNAFKHYIHRLETKTRMVDDGVTAYDNATPVVKNSQSEAFNEMISSMEQQAQTAYDSSRLDRERILSLEDGKDFYSMLRARLISPRQFRLLQSDAEWSAARKQMEDPKEHQASIQQFLDSVDTLLAQTASDQELDCFYKPTPAHEQQL